jgi:hypothetical protein
MPGDLRLAINSTQFYKAQKAVGIISSSGYYRGVFRTTLMAMLEIAKMYAEGITHRWTQTLFRSFEIEYNSSTMRGFLRIDQEKMSRDFHGNLRQPPQLVSEYGVYEHERGGTHAFFERTIRETAGILEMRGIRTLVTEVDRAMP